MAYLTDDPPSTLFRIMNPMIWWDVPSVDSVVDHKRRLPVGEFSLGLNSLRGEPAVEPDHQPALRTFFSLDNRLELLHVQC